MTLSLTHSSAGLPGADMNTSNLLVYNSPAKPDQVKSRGPGTQAGPVLLSLIKWSQEGLLLKQGLSC